MSFELTILGSSSALPAPNRFPTAHLLKVNERFFLIDCGEGTQIRLLHQKVTPTRIHHIFISHLHGDHVFGLPGLISSMGLMGRHTPLHLYGPSALKDWLELNTRFFPVPFSLHYHVSGQPEDALIFEDDKITVRSISLKHRTRTYGYLFREKKRLLNLRKEKIGELGLGIEDMVRIKEGADYTTSSGRLIPNRELTLPPYHQRSYAYLSDTAFDPALSEQVRGVDLMFHEATFAAGDEKLARETMHSTSVQAAILARQAGAGRLLIGHFSTRYKEFEPLVEEAREIFPNTDGVNDGDRYCVPLERVRSE
ncbi:MAG: ribonuclease Z [Bacteroidales bacterium]